MPGMMDTVLNIGLSDKSVQGLAKQAGDDRFAWDSYRRLIQMFGKTVLGVDGELFEDALEAAKTAKKVTVDTELEAADLKKLVTKFKRIVKTGSRPGLPAGPARADGPRDPRGLRLLEHRPRQALPPPGAHPARPRHRGQRLFDGLRQPRPRLGHGCGVHARPRVRHPGRVRRLLQNAEGEDVVAGIRNTVPLAELESIDKKSYDQLMQIMETLENHYKDLCDIEFTIERGQLWMLQTRIGERTGGCRTLPSPRSWSKPA